MDCDVLTMSGLIDLNVTHYSSWVLSTPYLGDIGINGQPVVTADDSSCVFEGDEEGGPGGSGGGGWDPELPCFLEITIDWFDGDGNYVGSTTHYLETTCPDDPI